MSDTQKVMVTVRHGPVRIRSLSGEGACHQFEFGNEIVIREKFPSVEGSAYYLLTLEKPVTDPRKVCCAHDDLLHALERLAEVWQFAGGYLLGMPQRQRLLTAILPPFESNEHEVECKLLAANGLKKVSTSHKMAVDWAGTYKRMPLKEAIALCRRADKDGHLRRLFQYYHWARIWEERWFVELYKVRDVLKDKYGNDKNAKTKLGISCEDWRYFGGILNNYGLRHARKGSDDTEIVSKEKRENCKTLARKWINNYLATVAESPD